VKSIGSSNGSEVIRLLASSGSIIAWLSSTQSLTASVAASAAA